MARQTIGASLRELDTELRVENTAGSLRLRWVGSLLDQLERQSMLALSAPRPSHWSESSVVSAQELVQWLQKHLTVAGWRAVLEQIRQHNEQDGGKPWDPSSPHDMLDAIEAALKAGALLASAPGSASKTVVRGDIVSKIQEQNSTLKALRTLLSKDRAERERAQVPKSAWILAPRAAAAVVRAQATSAQALAELERARSEAMLHALQMIENKARSNGVLAQIEDLRERLGPRLATYCQEHGIPVPQPGTEEEANLLFLFNAQLIALDDAQDEIARRGAALAREQIHLAEKSARATMEARALPLRLEAEVVANPARERLLCEEMRHRSARWGAQVIGIAGGALTGLLIAATHLVAAAIADTVYISGPPLLVFLLTLIAETWSYAGQLTGRALLGFVATSLWNGLLMLGFTLVGFALWRYLSKREQPTELSDLPLEEHQS